MRWRNISGTGRDRLEDLRLKTPEDLLGFPDGASAGEIRRAYLERVKAYHPDRLDAFLRAHGGEVMKILNAAYQRALARRGG